MNWVLDNATFVSAMATVFMAIVWLLYAHIGIVSILRQRRPRVIIDQTAERTLDTKFVIANLSQQPVYISCVMVAVVRDGDEHIQRISTYAHFMESEDEQSPRELESELRHGLLNPADLLMIGGSERILSWLIGNRDDEDFDAPIGDQLRRALSDIESFELRVIAAVGVEDKPVASRRTFNIEHTEDDIYIWPAFAQTDQLQSWSDRSTIDEWSSFCLRN